MEKVLVDTCIFIDIFRGNNQLYQDLLKQKIFVSSIVYMELIQGSSDKIEFKKIAFPFPLPQPGVRLDFDVDKYNTIFYYKPE